MERIVPWLETSAAPQETVKALNALAEAAAQRPEFLARADELTSSPDENIRTAAADFVTVIAAKRDAATRVEEQ